MSRNGSPEYYIRVVTYTRTEHQVIKANGNQKAYISPDEGAKNGEYYKRQASKEHMVVLEPLRILTESEAGILGLPFEGERAIAATSRD